MFEVDAELAAMLAWDDAVRAELPELSEPDPWLDAGEPLETVPTAELPMDCLADEPGVGALLTLSRLDPSTLTAGERIDLLVGLERHRAWLDALQQRALAVIDRADVSTEHWCQEAVMCALRVSATAAQTRLKTARTLTDELPRTLAALESGSISVRHAEVIADASWKLEPDVGTEFESLVLQRAAEQSLPELRRSIKRAALRVDPATAETRHQRARQDRCVRKTALADGMAELRLFFPFCNQPGYLCDLDHVVPWDEGGHTCPGNNAPGCRRHHNGKTHGGWRYRINPDGSFTITAPTGHTYTSRPPQRWNTQPGDGPTWEQKVHAAQQESEASKRAREDREHATYKKLLYPNDPPF
jgi:hypothetical protein